MPPPRPNRLGHEKSPYLLQHAHNPVDWWSWSDEAFDEARRRNVPVFLSIGYATCHWCHVMEEESFEDEEAAAALNRAFVPIKVDREERPDVDGIYMAAALALNGHGGWPLTALLVPETREPFFVATYLPKESRGGRIGVIDLAHRVSELWDQKHQEVVSSASQVATIIEKVLAESDPGELPTEDDLERAVGLYRRRFDPANGGFGSQPKFPAPHTLLFLLRQSRRTGDPLAADMAIRTLRAIARGGITDHAGGGVHRYSTDRRWLLPHFEKMLYDQAGLALAWTEAWQYSGDPDMRRAAEQTLDYVIRDLQQEHGGIASAEDADSLDEEGRREEGAFYVWREEELAEVLGEDALPFCRAAFGTRPEGNYLDEATRQLTGANVLHLPDDPVRLAASLDLSEEAFERKRRTALDALLVTRSNRPRPLLDDKVLADWNGLAIVALATAARGFDATAYEAAARQAASFILTHLRRDDGRLLHRWRDGEAAVSGLLDDYAFMAWGLLELYVSTYEEAYLESAIEIHREMRARFEAVEGGYFLTEEDTPDLLVRQRALDDGAHASGHAIAIYNGLRIGTLTGDRDTEDTALRALASDARIRAHPTGHGAHLLAAQVALGPSPEVVLVPGVRLREMEAALRSVYAPGALFIQSTPTVHRHVPFAESMTARGGRATAYVCERGACQAPTTEPAEAVDTLEALFGGNRDALGISRGTDR